jgi:hypothetical protein
MPFEFMSVNGLPQCEAVIPAWGRRVDDPAAPPTFNSHCIPQITSGKWEGEGIEYLGGSAETPVQIRHKIGFFRHTVKLPIEPQKNLDDLAE